MGVGFFFQGEEGMRDDLVTGVQTCALPITAAKSVPKCSDPTEAKSTKMPTNMNKSPTRVVRNAFIDARAAAGRSNQNPINRYEHSPTPSQPAYSSRKLFASTSVSIDAANR